MINKKRIQKWKQREILGITEEVIMWQQIAALECILSDKNASE